MKRVVLFFILLISASVMALQESDAQWVQTSAPRDAKISCFAFNASMTFAGSDSGLLISTDRGFSWQTADSGLTNTYTVYSCLVLDSTTILVGTAFQGVFRSTDDGATWKAVNTGLTNHGVYSLARSDSNIFAATGAGVFRSTDKGTSWQRSGLTSGFIACLAVSAKRADTSSILAGTGTGGVFRSTNNGSSWKSINTGLTNNTIWSIAIVDSNIFIGTGTSGIFLTTDNGASWNAVNTGLGNLNVQSFACVGKNIFAGTYGGGVFLSGDNGANWLSVNDGLGNWNVNVLGLNSGIIYAGIYGGGVWARALHELVGVFHQSSSQSPLRFSLKQNYPNPFNPNTNFEFRIANFGFVSLKVYDMLGREVATLVNEVKQPGEYAVRWNAEGIASGVYFYRLTAGSCREVKKMLYLR
ncbi:MAG: T9SS type A sorting domain-containing protein [Bacteroidota bacterium]|jgi:photosystem II stability/assembly factor-like uncharacterized protein